MAPVRKNKSKKEAASTVEVEKIETEAPATINGDGKVINGKGSNSEKTFIVPKKTIGKGKQKKTVENPKSEDIAETVTENGKAENGVVEEQQPDSSKIKSKQASKPAKEKEIKTGKRGRSAKKIEEVAENGSPEKKAKVSDNTEKPKRGRAAKVAVKAEEEDVKEELKVEATEKENGATSGNVKEKKTKNQKAKAQPKDLIPAEKPSLVDSERKTADGRSFSLKISSWNVAGLRSWFDKGAHKFLLTDEKPDILFVQETKLSKDEDLDVEFRKMPGYHCYSAHSKKKGYAGVMLYSKIMPMNVEYGLGKSEHDEEGRVITAEYEKFYLVGAYVPNSSRGLVRLEYRQTWNEDFLNYLKNLDAKKPVILCGDLNVAHQEIDLANPKTNKKNAGFTPEERADFTKLLKAGFVDAFRHLYPQETGAYTFWTNTRNCREKNVGWRLDYFVVSEKLVKDLCDCVLRQSVMGSDHCPLTVFLAM